MDSSTMLGYPCCGSLVTGQHLPECTVANTAGAIGPTPAGDLDPFGAMVARAELEKISERRVSHSAGEFAPGLTKIEAARLIARVLHLAAEKLGIPEDVGIDEMLHRILAGARRGGLDPVSYRIIWTLAHVPKHEAAAPAS
jgi:hypothetical protein